MAVHMGVEAQSTAVVGAAFDETPMANADDSQKAPSEIKRDAVRAFQSIGTEILVAAPGESIPEVLARQTHLPQTIEHVEALANTTYNLAVPAGRLVLIEVVASHSTWVEKLGLHLTDTWAIKEGDRHTYLFRLPDDLHLESQDHSADVRVIARDAFFRIPGSGAAEWLDEEHSPEHVHEPALLTKNQFLYVALRLDFVDNSREELPGIDMRHVPPVVGNMAQSVSKVVKIAPDLPVITGILTAGAAMSRRCYVQTGNTHRDTVNGYGLTGQPPSDRKTTSQNHMTRPLRERESEVVKVYQLAKRQHTNRSTTLDKLIAQKINEAIKAKGNERIALQREADSLEEARPEPPVSPGLIAGDDSSTEALGVLMREQGGVAFVLGDEAGGIGQLGDTHGRYQNYDLYLKSWNGGSFNQQRTGRPSVQFDNARLSLCLCMQVGPLIEILRNERFARTGLLSRMLFSFPNSLVGSRLYSDEAIDPVAKAAYDAKIRALYDVGHGDLVYQIQGEALEIWRQFHDWVEGQLKPGASLAHCADWGGKLPCQASKLAAIFHGLMTDTSVRDLHVSPEAVEMAVGLIRDYFIPHGLHAFSLANVVAQKNTTRDPSEMFSDFAKSRLKVVQGAKVKCSDVFHAYTRWCELYGGTRESTNAVGRRVKAIAGVSTKPAWIGTDRAYHNLELLEQ